MVPFSMVIIAWQRSSNMEKTFISFHERYWRKSHEA